MSSVVDAATVRLERPIGPEEFARGAVCAYSPLVESAAVLAMEARRCWFRVQGYR